MHVSGNQRWGNGRRPAQQQDGDRLSWWGAALIFAGIAVPAAAFYAHTVFAAVVLIALFAALPVCVYAGNWLIGRVRRR